MTAKGNGSGVAARHRTDPRLRVRQPKFKVLSLYVALGGAGKFSWLFSKSLATDNTPT